MLVAAAALWLLLVVVSPPPSTTTPPRRLSSTRRLLTIASNTSGVAPRLSRTIHIDLFLDANQQRSFVHKHCPEALPRFDVLPVHLAATVWEFCVMATSDADAVLWIDSESPLLLPVDDWSGSVAVRGDARLGLQTTVHNSLLLLDRAHRSVATDMLDLLTTVSLETLDATWIPKQLYRLVQASNGPSWQWLEQDCASMEAFRRRPEDAHKGHTDETFRINHACPPALGYCCSVFDSANEVVLMSRHAVLPYQKMVDDIPMPYNVHTGHYNEDELPYIATVSSKVRPRPPDVSPTPNFYDTLLESDCLPSSDACSKCLREKSGADCNSCASKCPCYCKTLCHEPVEKKFVAEEWTLRPPAYQRDPNRLVPRIVHQTWFEDLDTDKYPNMSRLAKSFELSGWEYKFYTDDQAGNFLSTHFPAAVREAYDALRPGAFKADLFRYCVLLIHGGVYADVDILLESSLDHAVPPDVGFMVPIDEPGKPVNKRMCLWNGFIAAAPGHPYLAKAIETVVNQVRNRFTSVDVDATFCPAPELSILHAFDTLFTAGPCLLGASINRVNARHPQAAFVAGSTESAESSSVPGKTIILHQDKWDMGAHRFTNLEKNLVVCATDLQDADDRASSKNKGAKTEHYSKTHAKTGIYGLENLYTDNSRVNEDVRFSVATTGSTKWTESISRTT